MEPVRERDSADLDARVRRFVAEFAERVLYQNAPDPDADHDGWYRAIARQLGWQPTQPRFWVESCDTFAAGGFVHPESQEIIYLLRLHGAPLAAWSATREYGRRIQCVEAPDPGYAMDYGDVELIGLEIWSHRMKFSEWIDLGCCKSDLRWFARSSRPSVAEVFFGNYD